MLQAVVVILFSFVMVSAIAFAWLLLVKKGKLENVRASPQLRKKLAKGAAVSPVPFLAAVLGAAGILIYSIAPEVTRAPRESGIGLRSLVFFVSVALSYFFLAGGVRRD